MRIQSYFGLMTFFCLSQALTVQVEGQPLAPNSRASDHDLINKTLVTSDPNVGAAKLYQFLLDNYRQKIISGVMTLNSFDETQWLKINTGKEPALVGLDFMHSGRAYDWYNDRQPIVDAKAYYDRNGIPAICWHWRDPSRVTEEFYTDKTSFDISKIQDETSSEYKAMIADIDFISGMLKELQDENIPVIWRPLHEAAGGWFWWGAKGPAPCKKLYQVMFDRMVNYHGLKNLIWVWTQEPNDDAWYPGDEFVDIVGRDLYRDGDHSSHIAEWTALNEKYSLKKMITMSECGSFPDVDNLVKDGASWSWYMPWYGQFTRDSKYNSLSLWKKMFASDYVITLDEMPDLKTYEAIEHDHVTSISENYQGEQIVLYPTHVDKSFFIKSKGVIQKAEVYNSLGQRLWREEPGSNETEIFVENFMNGIYYVKVDSYPVMKIFKK
jgi:mannan endo-1,4-beta-mannosidase